jgi:phage terminase Nu1 subunit (DNA packaging protein)
VVADLSAPVIQSHFGVLVGISQQAVSELVRRQVLSEGGTAGDWLRAYCEHLREVAAGRGGESSIELAGERARLAREQADKLAMQNAITRVELAPTRIIEEVLALTGARAARILDRIPGEIRRSLPQLTSDDIGAVSRIVAKAHRIAAGMSMSDLARNDEDDTSDDTGDCVADEAREEPRE